MKIQIPPGMQILWKPYPCTNMGGFVYTNDAGVMNVDGTRHYLEVLAMIPKRPLTFQAAMDLKGEEYKRRLSEGLIDELLDLSAHWVDWISAQGFHIVLTGAEFELGPEIKPTPLPEQITVSLTLQVAGQVFRVLTFKKRPPIDRVRILSDQRLVLYYVTGEQEEARLQCVEHPDSFTIETLWSELWKGKAPAVKPYAWAA